MPQKRFPDIPGNVLPGKPVSYRQDARRPVYLDWILPAILSYPQKYTLDVVPPEKIVWEEVEQAADSRENYEELLQHIDHAKPELLQQYDQWFSYRYPYQSEAGKKSKYSVSELNKDCRAGVAFFLGVIPVLVVARQIKCDLSFLQLGFLDAEKIGICGMKIIEKSFLYTGAQPVNVP